MRWLVTGVSGLLGANAALQLADRNDVVGVARRSVDASWLPVVRSDLADPADRKSLLARIRPDAVLHCAAVSSIEACERNPLLARQLNVDAASDLARQAAAIDARFVHISTDAVFDGTSGPYSESSPTSPTTEYGRTKRDAEDAVQAANPAALVARVNFYGWSPTGSRSLAEFFLNRLHEGSPVPGFTDVRVSTMYVGSLIAQIAQVCELGVSGILNVANDEGTTKFDFGRALARVFGYDESLVTPALAKDHLTIARGANLELDTKRLRALTGESTTQAGDLHLLRDDAIAGRRDLVRAINRRNE